MTQTVTPLVINDWRAYPPLDLPPIVEAALAEIVTQGYAATSVRRIAKRLGVTVYYHFENKQAILAALFDRAMEVVLGHAECALQSAGDDPAERFRVLVESVALYMLHHPDLAFISTERRSLLGENLERYVACRDQLEGFMLRAVADGVEGGALHPAWRRPACRRSSPME